MATYGYSTCHKRPATAAHDGWDNAGGQLAVGFSFVEEFAAHLGQFRGARAVVAAEGRVLRMGCLRRSSLASPRQTSSRPRGRVKC